MIQYEIQITGRVQGVGFRYFVHQKANEIGIKGWVKNARNNSVIIVVQGNKTDLETFIDYLKIGPTLSRVDRISKVEMDISKNYISFDVRH